MADLRTDDRGQLILLTGFILAVSFVVLALVVNSAIFTENLATRGDVPGSQDALEYRDEVEQAVGSSVMAVNQDNDVSAGDIEVSIAEIARRSGFDQSSLGRVVSVSHDGTFESGTKIAQDEPRGFTNESAAADWTLVEDVNRSRNVRLNITDPDVTGETFELVLNGTGGNKWNLNLTFDGNNVTLAVDPPTAGPETCERDFSDSLEIDLTRGTIDGDPCFALTRTSDGDRMWFGTGVTDYDLEISNGDAINGTYSLIVDDGSPVAQNFGTAPNEPYTNTDTIYSLDVRYEFYTPNVGYETDIRVAPGEVPT